MRLSPSLRLTPACNPCSGSLRRRSARYRTRTSPDRRHSDRCTSCSCHFSLAISLPAFNFSESRMFPHLTGIPPPKRAQVRHNESELSKFQVVEQHYAALGSTDKSSKLSNIFTPRSAALRPLAGLVPVTRRTEVIE